MRILGAIVEPATDLLAIGVADLSHRRRVSAKPVGHDFPRSAVFLHDPLEKLHRRRLVSLRGDDRFQDLAFMIDSAPEGIVTLPRGERKASAAQELSGGCDR